ncbi:MAG: Fic family protein [Deltaproteobacteria bacterium]|nr:MAG: Fic family protein [Deltaproteobacteria bacterium]TMQ05875.1 MAG: Fic family protein [Deltaproteobacteria bacterium]
MEEVLHIIGRHTEGVTVEQIAQVVKLPRRTLQRRLARLVADGEIQAMGQGKQRRYQPGSAEAARDELSVSQSGQQVRSLVRRPLLHRTPIGYVASLLEEYRPNRNFYLDEKLRSRLQDVGRAPGAERPAGTYARQILSRLLVDLSWASSRLEGNTYTRLDAQNLIELGRRAPGKDQREAQMILNHKAAIEMLVESVEEVGFDRYTICNLHALLADNLLADSSAAGRVRKIEVATSGTVYQPLAIPQQIDELFDRFLAKASEIADPFEQAFFAMVHLPYLQPFEDVNKRVSRLAANIPFVKRNLAPLSFVDVPERDYIDGILGVYELQRVELLRDVFAWAYERSCRRYTVVRDALPQPDPLRLRNREQLTQVVNAIVRDESPIDGARIRQLATPIVDPSDLEDFIAMAIYELGGLHEGNLARYRLRLSEFLRWRDRRQAIPPMS